MFSQLKKYIKLNENSEDKEIKAVCSGIKSAAFDETADPGFEFYPGMNIYVEGAVGAKGIKILTALKKADMHHFISENCISQALTFENMPLKPLHPDMFSLSISERGVMQSLFKLAKLSYLGFEINIEDIPILQSTIEISEFFKINPYKLFSADCRLIVSDDKNMKEFCIRQKMAGSMLLLRKIGSMKLLPDMIIHYDDSRSLLNRPGPDELLRFL